MSWWLVRFKATLGRGQGYVYFVKDMLLVSMGVIIFSSKFNIALDSRVLIALPFLYLSSIYIIGVITEEFYKKEASYSTNELNPIIQEIRSDIKELLRRK